MTFIDGLPFKPGYRKLQDQERQGVDDYASYPRGRLPADSSLREKDEPFPDILMIDGGKGQLNAALSAFEALGVTPPTVISLAKQNEEIFIPGRVRADRPQASAHFGGAPPPPVRPRRGPPLRPALSPHAEEEADPGRRCRVKYRDVVDRPKADDWILRRTVGSHLQYRHPPKDGTVTVSAGGKLSNDVPSARSRASFARPDCNEAAMEYPVVIEPADDGSSSAYVPISPAA